MKIWYRCICLVYSVRVIIKLLYYLPVAKELLPEDANIEQSSRYLAHLWVIKPKTHGLIPGERFSLNTEGHMSVHVSVYVSVHVSVYVSVHVCVCMCVCVCLCVLCVAQCLCVCVCVCVCVCLFLSISVFVWTWERAWSGKTCPNLLAGPSYSATLESFLLREPQFSSKASKLIFCPSLT
jgi:hypothetical protein